MFKFAHDVDSAEERFAVALSEFSKLALAPRRGPPQAPQLDSRQLELIALAHRALWFGVELRLGDRERSARGFAAVEMLHGETRAALRREIQYAREQHMLTLSYDIELGAEPLDRSETRLGEVAKSWRESAYELGLSTFARWLGEQNVVRELVELYSDLLRVVRVTMLPLRSDGPDPAYLRSLLTLARTGESGAAPRGELGRDLSPEQREQFRQDATRTEKLSALIAREESSEVPIEGRGLRARVAAIARGSDSAPPEAKLSLLSIDRAPALPSLRPAKAENENASAPEVVAPPAVAETTLFSESPVTESLPVVAMFGAQKGSLSLLRTGVALAVVTLIALVAMALMPVTYWFGPTATPLTADR